MLKTKITKQQSKHMAENIVLDSKESANALKVVVPGLWELPGVGLGMEWGTNSKVITIFKKKQQSM